MSPSAKQTTSFCQTHSSQSPGISAALQCVLRLTSLSRHADLAGFLHAASNAADLQTVVPLERWDMEAAYAPEQAAGRMSIYARFAALCNDVFEFDAAAFRVPRAEAVVMDPQQRLLLETAAAALADGSKSSFTG